MGWDCRNGGSVKRSRACHVANSSCPPRWADCSFRIRTPRVATARGSPCRTSCAESETTAATAYCDRSMRRLPVCTWTGLTWSLCMTRMTIGTRRSRRRYLHSLNFARKEFSGHSASGMNRAPMLAQFLRETPVDVVMLAGRYTLLEQDALEDVLAAAAAVDKSVVAVGVFNSGILAQPRPGPGARYDYEDAAPEVIARANEIADICEQHGTSLPAAAIAFPLAHPCVVNVTLGMRSAAEVQRNIKLYNSRVPPAAWSDLRAAGLLRRDAPSPV